MNIFTTTEDDFKSFKRFFGGHEVNLLPKNYTPDLKIDLLVFPGGSDVHPKRYNSAIPQNSPFEEWIDVQRDAWEFQVFTDYRLRKLRPKKVLGICRGMQFLNVALGGNLVYDIATRHGQNHPASHDIRWVEQTVFSSITHVNSSHHQGVYSIGDAIRPRMLASEPNTGILESILWGDSILGFQFHPEWWGHSEKRSVFSKGIIEWIEGKPIMTSKETDARTVRKTSSMWHEMPDYQAPSVESWFNSAMPDGEEMEFEPDEDEEEDE